MIRKGSARAVVLACAGIASLGLIAGVAPAAAKTKVKKRTVTRTATFSQCLNLASPVIEALTPPNTPAPPSVGTANFPVTLPLFRGLPQDGAVTGISNVAVRVSHTFDSDLTLVLVAPGSRSVVLASRRGGQGDGYGTGATSCAGSLVNFSDAFPVSINTPGNTGDNPITGNFRPEFPLAGLVGTAARGNWQLLVIDSVSGDNGSLNAASLSFTYNYLATVKVKKKKKK